MKNLDPCSGLKQITSGSAMLPRRLIVDLIRNKKININEFGYFGLAIISADWNPGKYRFGLIRQGVKDLAEIFNIPYATLNENFNKLIKKKLLLKQQGALKVNSYNYFQRPKAFDKDNPNNEIFNQLLENLLLKSEKSESKSEKSELESGKSDSNLSKIDDFIKIAPKVDNKVVKDSNDCQRIYSEGDYAYLKPEDMEWLDQHIAADGRTI